MSSNVVIKVENLTKEYRLGTINHGTLYHDLQSWWALLRGKEDPNSLLSHHSSSVTSGSSSNDKHFLALSEISFEVDQGDIVGVIGRNGAGKSTLLKILSQVTCPTSGLVKLKGRVASLLEVGTGFHPELTGRENIFLNGAILGMSKTEIRRKLDEIIAFAEVEKFVDTPVKRYSSGMYVRLAFAVAAHLEPEILIVDEVLAVGDAQFQKKCLGKMGEVGKEGRTILFVSHNMEAVSALCTKGLLLHGGRIAYEGNVHSAVNAYREALRSNAISVDNCFSRGGSGGVRIAKVWTSAESQEQSSMVMIGEPMSINIELELSPEYIGKNLNVGIGIDSANGQRIFTNVSSWEQSDIIINSEFGTVTCMVKQMLLVPGTYLVGVSVSFLSDTLDCAIQCAEFSVYSNNSDSYSSRDRTHGDIYIPCTFNVKNGSISEHAT